MASVSLPRLGRKQVDLSLASEVDRGLRLAEVAPPDQLAFLARAQKIAERKGDLELVAAIVQWRLRHQLASESPEA